MKWVRTLIVEVGLQIALAPAFLGLAFLLVGIFTRLGGSVGP